MADCGSRFFPDRFGDRRSYPKSGATDIEPEEASPDVLIYGAPDGKSYEGGFPESYELENDFMFTTEIPVTFGEDLQEFTYYLSAAYDIDYTLVLAIISKESALCRMVSVQRMIMD